MTQRSRVMRLLMTASALEAKMLFRLPSPYQTSQRRLVHQQRLTQKLAARRGGEESLVMRHRRLLRSRDGSKTDSPEVNLSERRIVKTMARRGEALLVVQLFANLRPTRVLQVWTITQPACEMSPSLVVSPIPSQTTGNKMLCMTRGVSAL